MKTFYLSYYYRNHSTQCQVIQNSIIISDSTVHNLKKE